MKTLLAFSALFFFLNSYAQKDSSAGGNSDTARKEFTTVQTEARFPGGAKGWQKYLEANLNSDLGAKYLKPRKGETITQVAMVSFLVNAKGEITDVQILNPEDVHPKLAAETIRVIKEGPKWIPAEQDGKKVIYRQRQSITWQVDKQ